MASKGKFCVITTGVYHDDHDVPHRYWRDPACFRTARQAKAELRRQSKAQMDDAEYGDLVRHVKFCTRSSPSAALRCKVTPLKKRGPVKRPSRRAQRRAEQQRQLRLRDMLPF